MSDTAIAELIIAKIKLYKVLLRLSVNKQLTSQDSTLLDFLEINDTIRTYNEQRHNTKN